MNFDNCKKIMKKDWKETIRNKEISIPMIILPFLFTVFIPILILFGVLLSPNEFIDAYGSRDQLVRQLNIPSHYNNYLVAAVVACRIFILPYFLFIPAFSSIIIAADSFAGEKERKTMEALALLPISKKELLVGKVLAAFIPAMAISLIFFGIQGLIVNLMLLPHLEGNILIFTDVTWLLTVLVLAPVFAFFNIIITVIISSRVRNFKNAQSISGTLVTPILIILFIAAFNPAFMGVLSILVIAGFISMLNIMLIRYGSKALDIEKLILML